MCGVLNVVTYVAGTVDCIGAQFGWHIFAFDVLLCRFLSNIFCGCGRVL